MENTTYTANQPTCLGGMIEAEAAHTRPALRLPGAPPEAAFRGAQHRASATDARFGFSQAAD